MRANERMSLARALVISSSGGQSPDDISTL